MWGSYPHFESIFHATTPVFAFLFSVRHILDENLPFGPDIFRSPDNLRTLQIVMQDPTLGIDACISYPFSIDQPAWPVGNNSIALAPQYNQQNKPKQKPKLSGRPPSSYASYPRSARSNRATVPMRQPSSSSSSSSSSLLSPSRSHSQTTFDPFGDNDEFTVDYS